MSAVEDAKPRRRSQFYREPLTLKMMEIDCNSGIELQVNEQGTGLKRYHLNITGVASSPRRHSYASRINDQTARPDIGTGVRIDKVKLPDVLPQQSLRQFMPRKSYHEQLANFTSSKSVLDYLAHPR